MDSFFIDHIRDLSKRSEDKCIFTFTNFLNGEEINELNIHRNTLTHFELFGGAPGTERQMARFGDENELYYREDFPIDCVKIEPLNIKFAEALTHRDILGSIMNLSIEREHIGDIVIKDSTAFVFVTRKMSDFICENLTRVKHTSVKCEKSEFTKTDSLFTLEERDIISSSLRADCVTAAVYNLSRSTADSLFESKKVFLNSALLENPSKQLKPSDTVSVRGFGKFIFDKEVSSTKKGRLKLKVNIYK